MKIDAALLEADTEARILLLPPTKADSQAIRKVLDSEGVACHSCTDATDLCQQLALGAAAILIAEETMAVNASPILKHLSEQPVWSDLPVLILSAPGAESRQLGYLISALGNATVVERPIRVSTLLSMVGSAFRARERQYQVRQHLDSQHRVEQTLRDSDMRLALALRTGRLGVFEIQLKQLTLECSTICRENFGRAFDAVFDYADFWGATHPDDVDLATRAVDAAIKAKSDYDIEYRVIWPDASIHWLLVRGSTEVDGEGQPQRMVGVTLDITERKDLEEQRLSLLEAERSARAAAERSVQMKDEFVATVSHELRTPLNAILGWSRLLNEREPDAERLSHGLRAIERSARSQTQIIQDLLDMSSILSGKMMLDNKPTDLLAVLTGAIDIALPSAEAKSIKLIANFEPDRAVVIGDETRLQQVFWNLISNAVKFTPEAGTITIELLRTATQFRVTVTDTGAGIDEAFLPNVFDRFRQADASITRKIGGMGLGLAIVKELVDHHGGSVAAHSSGLGKGATFTVLIPVAETPTQSGLDSSEQLPGAAAEGAVFPPNVHILVVDDEPDSREFMRRVLEDQGANVRVADSAASAFDLMKTGRFDVLVSDIGMPGEDGYSLIRRIRALSDSEGGRIPAIAVTAYARVEDKAASLIAGFNHHLAKPINTPRLFKLISEAVALAQAPGHHRTTNEQS